LVVNASGVAVGTLDVSEAKGELGTSVILEPGALRAGDLGTQIHETGSCDPGGDHCWRWPEVI
jgi:Cu/Zn superoxide dismutase